MIKNKFLQLESKNQVPPTAQKKFKEKFPQFPCDWKKIYSLPFTVTIEAIIREFQYKVVNNIVFTNEKVFRLKMTDSPYVPFVNERLNPSNQFIFLL